MSNTEKVNTSAEAVEARIAWLESNSYFGIVGTTDHHAELAVVLRALLRERDEARAHYNDVLAENDALRFVRNNLAASLVTARADALREAVRREERERMASEVRCEAEAERDEFFNRLGRITSELGLPMDSTAGRIIEAIRDAVDDEREACASVSVKVEVPDGAESWSPLEAWEEALLALDEAFRAAIRARGGRWG